MGGYSNLAFCDLRGVNAQAARSIDQFHNVAVLIFPRDADVETAAALAAIPCHNVSFLLYLDRQERVSVRNGVCFLDDSDAAPDIESTIVVNGTAFLESLSPNRSLTLYVNGSLIMRPELRDHVGIKIVSVNGAKRVLDFGEVFSENEAMVVDAAFLRYIKPKTILSAGERVQVASDVTLEMLEEKQVFLIAGERIVCHQDVSGYVRTHSDSGEGVTIK